MQDIILAPQMTLHNTYLQLQLHGDQGAYPTYLSLGGVHK